MASLSKAPAFFTRTAGLSGKQKLTSAKIINDLKGGENVTVENCEFAAVRPIKLWEGGASGTIVIKNNTFDMSLCSIDTENTNKNVAIMFSTLGSGFGYGNIEVSGNTVKGNATAFLSFYNTTCPAMAAGATFTVAGNTLNGAKLGVLWKSAEYWMPTCAIIK